MKRLRDAFRLLLDAGKDFGRDDALTHGAALAFFTASSLAPMVVIFLWVGGLVGGTFRDQFLGQVEGTLGQQGAEAIENIVLAAEKQRETSRQPIVLALALAAFSATAVFAQLQKTLNRIWNVKAKPGFNLWGWIRKRLLSFALLAGLAFLLLVSLAVSTALATLFTQESVVGRVLELVVSMAVTTVLFAVVFRWMPDVKITWRETWSGAFITALLFAAGKYAIGTYLGMSSVGKGYGAAGSMLILLVWVYWSSAIVLYGAEVTQAYVSKRRNVFADEEAVEDTGEDRRAHKATAGTGRGAEAPARRGKAAPRRS